MRRSLGGAAGRTARSAAAAAALRRHVVHLGREGASGAQGCPRRCQQRVQSHVHHRYIKALSLWYKSGGGGYISCQASAPLPGSATETAEPLILEDSYDCVRAVGAGRLRSKLRLNVAFVSHVSDLTKQVSRSHQRPLRESLYWCLFPPSARQVWNL